MAFNLVAFSGPKNTGWKKIQNIMKNAQSKLKKFLYLKKGNIKQCSAPLYKPLSNSLPPCSIVLYHCWTWTNFTIIRSSSNCIPIKTISTQFTIVTYHSEMSKMSILWKTPNMDLWPIRFSFRELKTAISLNPTLGVMWAIADSTLLITVVRVAITLTWNTSTNKTKNSNWSN